MAVRPPPLLVISVDFSDYPVPSFIRSFHNHPKSFLGLRGFHNHTLLLRFSQPPRPLLILRMGTYPPSVSLPTSGGSSTAPTRRSYTKVLLPKIGRSFIVLRNRVAIFYAHYAPLYAVD